MDVDILLGLQWGDEGKGKIVDVLSERYNIVARFQGGPNAGHTLEFNNEKHILHTIPSGIFRKDTHNIIGNGVVIDPVVLENEAEKIHELNYSIEKRLHISVKAHLILPTHRMLDAAFERAKGKSKIGSTLKGIGPVYTDKTARIGIRVGDILKKDFLSKYKKTREHHFQVLKEFSYDPKSELLDNLPFNEYEKNWFDSLQYLKKFNLISTEYLIRDFMKEGKKVLAEGAQGTMLDVDFGSYPFVTSSNTISAAACTGLGIGPHCIGTVYGLFKAYCTRVGSGPFPTELNDENGNLLQKTGNEFGSTTGRPRRCGWLDLVALKYAVMINSVDKLILTKLDVFNSFREIFVATDYQINNKTTNRMPFEINDANIYPVYKKFKGWMKPLNNIDSFDNLPLETQKYIDFIENYLEIPVVILSTGPARSQIIRKE